MFPGELKRIFAQVVQARQEGLAALEKARGETAPLRNLANAARTLAANPALLQLRTLQTMEAGRLAHVVTLDAGGSPHITLAWIGLDGGRGDLWDAAGPAKAHEPPS